MGKSGNSRDFGEEAINEMMSVMQQKDSPVFIFAGYVDDMRDFFAVNEGLFRRVNRRFIFADMSVQHIVDLFRIILKHSPFALDADVSDEDLAHMLEEHTTKPQRSKLNGSLVKLTLSRAKAHLDRRLTISSTIDELSTYTSADIINALKELPKAF